MCLILKFCFALDDRVHADTICLFLHFWTSGGETPTQALSTACTRPRQTPSFITRIRTLKRGTTAAPRGARLLSPFMLFLFPSSRLFHPVLFLFCSTNSSNHTNCLNGYSPEQRGPGKKNDVYVLQSCAVAAREATGNLEVESHTDVRPCGLEAGRWRVSHRQNDGAAGPCSSQRRRETHVLALFSAGKCPLRLQDSGPLCRVGRRDGGSGLQLPEASVLSSHERPCVSEQHRVPRNDLPL